MCWKAVLKDSPAERAGFKPGDVITTVNGEHVDEFGAFAQTVMEGAGQTFHVTVLRQGQRVAIDVTARTEVVKLPDGTPQKIGQLGLASKTETAGFLRALQLGTQQTFGIVTQTLDYMGKMITGKQSTDQLRGPLGIAKLYGDVASNGVIPLITLAAIISVSIGFLNLFPIPVLDGGHLLYYACEAVLGRPLGEKTQEVGFRVGLVLVLCLMLLATFNDLVRLNPF